MLKMNGPVTGMYLYCIYFPITLLSHIMSGHLCGHHELALTLNLHIVVGDIHGQFVSFMANG